MALRTSKIILLAAVAFFFFTVFLNNVVLDYAGNYEFVRHVLSMDTVDPTYPEIWRAIRPGGTAPQNHWIYHAFYWAIIATELATFILCTLGATRLWRARHASATTFNAAKATAIYGLTLSLLQWFTISLTIGGEWFLMFLSKGWDAQGSAFRMFACLGIVLIYLALEDKDAPAPSA
jgi:predicted small integral membrane protein